jgi:hypothetical protein
MGAIVPPLLRVAQRRIVDRAIFLAIVAAYSGVIPSTNLLE